MSLLPIVESCDSCSACCVMTPIPPFQPGEEAVREIPDDLLRPIRERIAADQQFDLLPNSQLSREGQVAQQMTSRRVLYRDSAIDISEELIIRMNNDYAASTGTR